MDTRLGLVVHLLGPPAYPGGPPRPDPVYGTQLQDRSTGWAPHEGRVLVDDEEVPVLLGDLQFGALADDVVVSPRVAPPMIGLGLLEAVPAEAVLAAADPDDADGDGISGRPNLVPDPSTGTVSLGRFGWKAGKPSVTAQTVAALHQDLGLTSPGAPVPDCPPAQADCAAAPSGAPGPGGVEVDGDTVATLAFYSRTLAVPGRRDRGSPEVGRGRELFGRIGCAACHRPRWETAADAELPALAGRVIEPYTDLLVHDLGEGLADGGTEYLAGGREWRTPPLWGIGLTRAVAPGAGYLHDGRARTLAEAILWHGGEAAAARERFRTMPAQDRAALLAFLESL
jgi:CxxC motif-containing protein (DUF1111 family)